MKWTRDGFDWVSGPYRIEAVYGGWYITEPWDGGFSEKLAEAKADCARHSIRHVNAILKDES